MSKRVAILISGGGSNMVTLVKAMQDGTIDGKPVLVLSNRPEAAGLDKARDLGVETAVVDHKPFHGDREGFERALDAELSRVAPDVICLAGFMRILTPGFIENWSGKMLNIHPSLLPLFKGLHTHQRAIDAGMREHGCSVHEVTPELDGGPILGQAVISINEDDTAQSLAKRVLPLEHRLYPAVLARFIAGKRGKITL